MTGDVSEELKCALLAAEIAAREIMSVYAHEEFQVQRKDDLSPLTEADERAHAAIVSSLEKTKLPLLSEEGSQIPFEIRKDWDRYWLIDPLDGTKEFLKRNGEFTVNIALMERSRPVMGVVAVPATGHVYYGERGLGAFVRREGVDSPMAVRKPVDRGRPGLRVVASRSHLNSDTSAFLETLNKPVLVSSGSSLKFILVASGKADLYPRFAPTMEWDTAAAHAIVNEVGLGVYQNLSAEPLTYNKPNLMNPYFICG